jgi:hypothetical protein
MAREGATPREKREAVARFASTFFGTDIAPEDVVEESLVPATRGGPPTPEELRAEARRRPGGFWRGSFRWEPA